MKILILVIYSRVDCYDRMLEVQRKYMHNYENADVYFIQSSNKHNDDITVNNDMIYVRGNENNSTILHKSLAIMRHFKDREYDFTIRTNISTIFNIPKLIDLLEKFKEIEYLYGGDIAGLHRFNRPIRFALGTCIILSKKLSDMMIEKINLFNHMIEDDVSFGLFVEDHIPHAFDHDLKTGKYVLYSCALKPNGYHTKLNNFISFIEKNGSDYVYYRNSLSDRYEDVKIMNYIVNNLLTK